MVLHWALVNVVVRCCLPQEGLERVPQNPTDLPMVRLEPELEVLEQEDVIRRLYLLLEVPVPQLLLPQFDTRNSFSWWPHSHIGSRISRFMLTPVASP